jgi:hypothetical protein
MLPSNVCMTLTITKATAAAGLSIALPPLLEYTLNLSTILLPASVSLLSRSLSVALSLLSVFPYICLDPL